MLQNLFFVFAFGFFGSQQAIAKVKIPNCDSSIYEKPSSLESPGLSGLGLKYLVARRSLHSIEKQGQPLLQVEQSFETGKRQLKCSESLQGQSFGSSLYVPTLINFTGNKEIKNSYWQFQLSLDNGKVGIWSRKSRIVSREQKSLQALIEDQGLQIQVVKLNQSTVDLLFQRRHESLVESVMVTFDIVDRF